MIYDLIVLERVVSIKIVHQMPPVKTSGTKTKDYVIYVKYCI